jgi:hypothetical protein
MELIDITYPFKYYITRAGRPGHEYWTTPITMASCHVTGAKSFTESRASEVLGKKGYSPGEWEGFNEFN